MDPITQKVLLGSSASTGEDAWIRANVRISPTYYGYPSSGNIHTAYDNDHIYIIYSLEQMYNGQNGYRTHRGEFWKVKKKDGSTVWHKSYQNVDGSYENFEIFGADISSDGNYIVVAGNFNKEGVPYGQSGNARYGFVEISTADGTIRTTADGALLAGGVKDDNGNNDDRRYGGIVYVPGSTTDFIIPGENGGPAYGGFGRVNKGSTSYSQSYHVDMYNQSPFDSYVSTNTSVRSLTIDPDNSNLMWINRIDYYNSDYYNYILLYDISGSTPTYVCGIRLRATAFDGRCMFTPKYTSNSNIDLYTYIEKSSVYSHVTKYSWNGSSWSAQWQNTLTVSNGGYGPRRPQCLTLDTENDRLTLLEGDPPGTWIVRQLNTSTGANVAIRRIAFDDDNTRTSWNLTANGSYGEDIVNSTTMVNPCPRAINGYMYAVTSGADPYYNNAKGAITFKLSTDISELPSTVTTYNTLTQGNSYSAGIAFGISDDDPTGSYSSSTTSFDGTIDNIGSHTPTLYGSNSGPMQYYNWNENSCDEWRTADTTHLPSDTQITID